MKKEKTVLFFLLGCVFVWLWAQIKTFYVPDSDFTYYLLVGRLMLQDPLSPYIISAPLYPVVLYLFQLWLPFQHAGLIGGIAFNISCFTLTVFYIWNIAKKYLGWYGIFPIVLFVISPLGLYVNLQPINLPLGLLLVVASIYYFEKRPRLAYVLALFAILARIENIVVFIIFTFIDKIGKKRRFPPPWAFLCFLLVIGWNLRPLEQSHNYLSEISARQQEVPNVAFIRNSFVIAPWSYDMFSAPNTFPASATELLVTLLMTGWVISAVVLLCKNNKWRAVPLIGFVVGYSAIHVLFPDKVLRYSYPLLPFVYVLLFYPFVVFRKNVWKIPNRVVVVITTAVLFVCLAAMSLGNRNEYIRVSRWDRAERWFMADWLNKNVLKPTMVYAFEFYVHQYYVNNKNITYIETTQREPWTRDLCQFSEDIFIVFDNETEAEGSYFDHLHGLDYFKRMWEVNKSEHVLDLIYSFEYNGRWSSVYKFIKPSDVWCEKVFQ